MTKIQIDEYFTTNWTEIKSIVKSTSNKSATKNIEDITSEIYLICIEKSSSIVNIAGFIRILASNIYRWHNSEFNIFNKILANENEFSHTYIEECTIEIANQRKLFAIEKYRASAETHEKILLDLYETKGIRTVRAVKEHLQISHHGANILIKEFKQKIIDYEREIET